MYLRNIQQKEIWNLALEMTFLAGRIYSLCLLPWDFIRFIFVRLSVGLFTEMLNKQLWTCMDVMCDKWYTLMIDLSGIS